VFRVASGGIHVHHIPALYEIHGNEARGMDLWARVRFDE
jgi:ribulose 1,5-bisphosphate carboxylase large subunit-like protein